MKSILIQFWCWVTGHKWDHNSLVLLTDSTDKDDSQYKYAKVVIFRNRKCKLCSEHRVHDRTTSLEVTRNDLEDGDTVTFEQGKQWTIQTAVKVKDKFTPRFDRDAILAHGIGCIRNL